MNTTTAAKVIESGRTALTVVIDEHRYTGTVSVANGFAYLTVNRGQYSEYSITLGGVHTPFTHR